MVKVVINCERGGTYRSHDSYTIEVATMEEAQKIKKAYKESSRHARSDFVDEDYLRDNFNITDFEQEDGEPDLDCDYWECYLEIEE